MTAEADREARELVAWLARIGGPPGDPLPPPHVFADRVGRITRKLGLVRPPGQDADATEEDPRWLVWWLLRMAVATYRRLVDPLPPVDPRLVERFRALTAARPGREEEHAQLHVDAESALRRALAIRSRTVGGAGPVLAVGDDDAVTVALALLGVPDLHAVDIDERVLEFLERTGRDLGHPIRVEPLDVYRDPVPASLRHRCAAVVTDPPRSAEGALPFLLLGAAALRREGGGRLFWADHPDWSFDYPALRASLEEAGLCCVEVLEDLHAYPLGTALFPRLRASASAAGVEAAWLEGLVERARAYSHLHVLSGPAERARAGTRPPTR